MHGAAHALDGCLYRGRDVGNTSGPPSLQVMGRLGGERMGSLGSRVLRPHPGEGKSACVAVVCAKTPLEESHGVGLRPGLHQTAMLILQDSPPVASGH